MATAISVGAYADPLTVAVYQDDSSTILDFTLDSPSDYDNNDFYVRMYGPTFDRCDNWEIPLTKTGSNVVRWSLEALQTAEFGARAVLIEERNASGTVQATYPTAEPFVLLVKMTTDRYTYSQVRSYAEQIIAKWAQLNALSSYATRAEAAQTAAETAETNAETAETAAEAAQTAAEAAQTAAAASQVSAQAVYDAMVALATGDILLPASDGSLADPPPAGTTWGLELSGGVWSYRYWNGATWSTVGPSILTEAATRVSTVAALQAVGEPDTGRVIYLEGKDAAFDGAGGHFAYDPTSTETEDEYRVVQPTIVAGAGRFLRTGPYGREFLSDWAGMDRTGATDVTTKMQNFLSAAEDLAWSSSERFTIVLEPGIYTISDTIWAPTSDALNGQLQFRGRGWRQTQIVPEMPAQTTPVFDFSASSIRQAMVADLGIHVDTLGAYNQLGVGFLIGHETNAKRFTFSTLRNVHLRGLYKGLQYDFGWTVLFDNVRARDCYNGFEINYGNGLTFLNVSSDANSNDGIYITDGHNLLFLQTELQNNTGFGIHMTSPESVHLVDCRFEANTAGAIDAATTSGEEITRLLIDNLRAGHNACYFGKINEFDMRGGRWDATPFTFTEDSGRLVVPVTNVSSEDNRQQGEDDPYEYMALERVDHKPHEPLYELKVEEFDFSGYAARTGNGLENISDYEDYLALYFTASAADNGTRVEAITGIPGALNSNRSVKFFMNAADYTDADHIVQFQFKTELAEELCRGNFLSFLLPLLVPTTTPMILVTLYVGYTDTGAVSRSKALCYMKKTYSTFATDPRGRWNILPFLADLRRIKPVGGGANEDGYTWASWDNVKLNIKWHEAGSGVPTSDNWIRVDNIPFFDGKFPPEYQTRLQRQFESQVQFLKVKGEDAFYLNVGGTYYKPSSIGGSGELIMTAV